MKTLELDVQGMTCQHCVKSAQRALAEVPGVKDAQVDLAGAKACVEADDAVDAAALVAALAGEGYKATPRAAA